mmetsp:Transcript_32342/g.59033  ORF Transcript_32342/g.59033 Transcript_32342/m.59033 type:complete len:461 (+) Transcript_32342:81-1463(+)
MQDRPAEANQVNAKDRSRWIVLILTCLGLFGQFYAFDNPSALNEQLKLHMATLSPATSEKYDYYFNLLYSVYSLPNVALPLLMGMAVDKCGCRRLICFLGCCVVMGHVLFATGVHKGSWTWMIAGRVLFGIGGESMQVAQNCLLFRWFKGNEVAFALGLNLSIARSGSVLNDVLSPLAAGWWGVAGAMWLGAFLCFLSCLCNIGSAWLDNVAGKKAGLPEATNDEEVSVREVFSLPKIFWLLTALCVLLYCGILPFNNIASAFFVETFFMNSPLAQAQQLAGNAMSVMFLVSALGTPPFGGFVDLLGMRAQFLLMSAGLMTLTYFFIFTIPPVASMFGLGLTYTIFAGALWPTFALTVPQRQLGTAYGVATALQNGGLAVVPMLVGHLQAAAGPGEFHEVMRLFGMFGVASFFVAVEIVRMNAATKGVLNLPSKLIEQQPESSGEATRLLPMDKKLPAQA